MPQIEFIDLISNQPAADNTALAVEATLAPPLLPFCLQTIANIPTVTTIDVVGDITPEFFTALCRELTFYPSITALILRDEMDEDTFNHCCYQMLTVNSLQKCYLTEQIAGFLKQPHELTKILN